MKTFYKTVFRNTYGSRSSSSVYNTEHNIFGIINNRKIKNFIYRPEKSSDLYKKLSQKALKNLIEIKISGKQEQIVERLKRKNRS
jgi:ERCC4-related helicase